MSMFLKIRMSNFSEGRSPVVETFSIRLLSLVAVLTFVPILRSSTCRIFGFSDEGCSMALEGAIVATSLVPPVLSDPSVLSDFSDQIISS